MTTGLLEYGQAGSYNAPDDRRVISALVAGRSPGVVKPVVLTAGSGLNVNVAAGWLAVVDCGDGTNGVVGTGSALVVPGAAGDAGAPRTDSLWCDINLANGTFALVIIPQSAETGRLGIRLATIQVPTAANLASAFTLTPVAAVYPWVPKPLPAAYAASSSSNYNPPTSLGDIPGASVTFTTTGLSSVFVFAVFDMAIATGGTNFSIVGGVVFDGTPNPSQQVINQLTGAADRMTIPLVALYSNVAAGSHTAKLQAQASSGANGVVRSPQTYITVLTIPV